MRLINTASAGLLSVLALSSPVLGEPPAAASAGQPADQVDIIVIDRSGRHLRARGGAITEADSMRRRRQMAEQGDIDQMYRIGQSYFWGWGVTRDKDEARRWFERAAANGHEDARRKLEAYPP